jgi:hypothetical protein
VIIRRAGLSDMDAVWRIFEPILRTGETYALPHDWSRAEALAYWFSSGHEVFVAHEDTDVSGSYYLHANQRGGAHVALRLHHRIGGAPQRHRDGDVPTLAAIRRGPRLSGDAVQRRHQRQRTGRAALAALGL